MKSMFASKKAVNDVSILSIIIFIFIAIGVFLPYARTEFENETGTEIDTTDFQQGVIDDAGDVTAINAFSVLLSVLKMFFWTFGDIWWVIDLAIFVPLRLLFVIIIARNIWVGGGA